MHAWEAIEQSLNFIEQHLDETIPTEKLAETACLSPFYFQRLFKRLVRKPVQEYIKLRRLARVCEELNDPERRILDIALDYGFSSHANFTRAFQEAYNITPQEYRKTKPMLNTFDRPELSSGYVLVEEGVPLIAGQTVLEIRRETLQETQVYLGLQAQVKISGQIPVGESTGVDIPGQLWREFHEKKEGISGLTHGGAELGMSHSADPQAETFTYFAGGAANSAYAAEGNGLVKQVLPAGDYIVCKAEAETFEQLVTTALNQAGKYLFETWLNKHSLSTQPFSAEKYYKEDGEINCVEIWVAPLAKQEIGL